MYQKYTLMNFCKGAILSLICLLGVSTFVGCSDDDEFSSGTPYFRIEGNPTGLQVGNSGNLDSPQEYIVRSNREWEIRSVAKEGCDWVRFFPAEGKADGIFRLMVQPNNEFVDRSHDFAFIVGGVEQPVLFRIEQESGVPSLSISESNKEIQALPTGGEVRIAIEANVEVSYEIKDQPEWVKEVSFTNEELVLSLEKNPTEFARTLVVKFYSKAHPNLVAESVIEQASASLLLYEDFSWLPGSPMPHVSTGELRFDKWNFPQNIWESPQTNGFIYSREGYAKFGKKGQPGILISPALSGITTDKAKIKIKFKALRNIGGSGKPDSTDGSGESGHCIIEVDVLNGGTPTSSSFEIHSYPKKDLLENDKDYNMWEDEECEFSFVVEEATPQTRIQFASSTEGLGPNSGYHRILLDDIVITIEE